MTQETDTNTNKFSNRSLGTVFWIEAPAIYILFMMASYGIMIILEGYVADSTIKIIHFILMGLGTIIASNYILIVSKNTSKPIFTLLARILAVSYILLFIATTLA